MLKPYNIDKARWKRKDDGCLLRGEGRTDDIAIPVMGSTGVGKSTFINNVLKALGSWAQAPVDDSFEPCTSKMAHYVVDLSSFDQGHYQGRRLILVDTPGFDHMSLSNEEVLRRIAVWLASSYGDGIKVAGVVYVHAIAPDRMTEGHASGLEIFQKICGEDALPSIVLATSRWDIGQPERRLEREGELRNELWKHMLDGPQRATMLRLDNSTDSALEIVKTIVGNMTGPASHGTVLLLQRQIVEEKKSYAKTDAGLIAKPRTGPLDNVIAVFKRFLRLR